MAGAAAAQARCHEIALVRTVFFAAARARGPFGAGHESSDGRPPPVAATEEAPVPRIPRLVPYAAVLAFAIWCTYSLRGDLQKISLEPLLRSWDVIAIATLLSLINLSLRTVRWRNYLARLGHQMPRRFSALAYVAGFAYTLLPGKVGEMTRARYYRPLGVPLTDVAAAFFAERLMDLVAVVMLACLLFAADARYAGAVMGAALLILAVLCALGLTPWGTLRAWFNSQNWIPDVLRPSLTGLLSALISTRPLLRPRVLASGLVLGLAAWGCDGAGLGLLSSIYPTVHLSPMIALGIYGVAVLVGGLSLLPGGLGSTEAVMTALLVAHGHTGAAALLVTLVCRLVTLWLALCLGWIAVLLLRQRSLEAVTQCR